VQKKQTFPAFLFLSAGNLASLVADARSLPAFINTLQTRTHVKKNNLFRRPQSFQPIGWHPGLGAPPLF